MALGCGGGLLLLLLVSASLFYFVQQFAKFSMNPQEAEQIAQSIMGYRIPGGSQGLVAMNISGIQIAGVASARNPESVVLMVGKVPPGLQGDPAAFEQAFQESVERQTIQAFKIRNRRTEPRQLCGQRVNLTVLEGMRTLAESDSAVPAFNYQALVPHHQSTLFVSLSTSGAEAQTTAESVFNSLRCQ